MDMVSGMFRVETGSTNDSDDYLLIHFWSSNDIYKLDLSDQTYAVQVTDTAVPALASVYDTYMTREHATQGMFYMFQARRWMQPPEVRPDILVLMDTDKDGVIDGTLTLTLDETQWVAGDYWKGDSWLNNWPD